MFINKSIAVIELNNIASKYNPLKIPDKHFKIQAKASSTGSPPQFFRQNLLRPNSKTGSYCSLNIFKKLESWCFLNLHTLNNDRKVKKLLSASSIIGNSSSNVIDAEKCHTKVPNFGQF